MECSENNKIIRDFITTEESSQIVNWIDNVKHDGDNRNRHLKELTKVLRGNSYVFDISNTPLTNYVTSFQSMYSVSSDGLPDFIHDIINRVAERFGFSKDNIYLQAVDMSEGGKIHPHYDASINGYINYKCNISVLSEDYDFYIDKTTIKIKETDLYGFEASLYKHWTDEFSARRIFLSIGFILSYDELSRSIDDPRVRMSRRIEKYFQK